MNGWDLALLLLLALAVFLALRHMVKLRKKGGCSCGGCDGRCEGCACACKRREKQKKE